MIASDSANLELIAERNRRNAQHSTGPRTPAGKAAASRNARKHGLCANPAAGTVEDRAAFDQLHDELIDRIEPQNLIEAGLVHRIAVSLWRLQRAARVDAAAGNIAVRSEPTGRRRVQTWIDRIIEGFWQVECVEVRDSKQIPKSQRHAVAQRGGVWRQFQRRFLVDVDREREEEMADDGAALAAMATLLQDLADALKAHEALEPVEAQLLAWLLGESAARLLPPEHVEDRRALYYPDECDWASPTDALIGQARKRPAGEPITDELLGLIQARLTSLWNQARVAREPYLDAQVSDRATASLLPDAATLDRLIRYETHADRALHRSIEALAKLRGATLEAVRTGITGGYGTWPASEARGQRTLWEMSRLQ